MSTRSVKVYVCVHVEFDEDGHMFPRSLQWEDGHVYEIDRVLDIRPGFAARAGGGGDRYKVRVGRQETELFFEHSPEYGKPVVGRWFVERKET